MKTIKISLASHMGKKLLKNNIDNNKNSPGKFRIFLPNPIISHPLNMNRSLNREKYTCLILLLHKEVKK